MDRGRIVEAGPPAELFASPRTRFVADFLAEAIGSVQSSRRRGARTQSSR